MSTTQKDRLRALLDPVAAGAGVDLEDLSVTQAGRNRLLRVIVDADGGVDLDALARVSREVSEALDAAEVMGEAPYRLEVTTPGVDRPLTAPRHWRRASGRLVKAVLTDGRTVTGRVAGAGDEGAELDVDGTARPVAYAEVAKATVQVEFSRPKAGADEDDMTGPGGDPDDHEEA